MFNVPAIFKINFVIERKNPGAYVDGVWIESTVVETIRVTDGTVQPSSSRDKQILPEGLRVKQSISVYSSTEIRGYDEETRNPSDIILYNGKRWDVHQSWFHETPYNHYKGIAVLVDGQ